MRRIVGVSLLAGVLGATWSPTLALSAQTGAKAFGLDDVAEKAKKLAAKPFQDPRGQVPDWLLKLSYDQWRDVRFRPERALWRDKKLPFQVQFFHPGLYYDRTVKLSTVDSDGVKPLEFSPSNFDYGKNDFASKVPQDLGYAGFRLHYPIKKPDYHDEVIVFLGASYFRAVGRDQGFGLSARGISIDTAESRGEEFPYFREYWLVRPTPTAKEMTVYALLDSPSLTGAYKFTVGPGEQTAVKVEVRLFLRNEVTKLGMAPLTSMFFHGENTNRWFDDFRPEVHDSDGLMMAFANGEWLWRPLDNPKSLDVSAFETENPKGFGLIQRDRDFEHYQDLETRQEERPSVWIEPGEGWGPGRVELVEIPTNADINDNIVGYWVPTNGPKIGEAFAFSYTMYWYGDDPDRPPGGKTVATRRDPGPHKDAQRFVIDFASKKLAAIPGDRVLRGVVSVVGGPEAGEVIDQHVAPNPHAGGWRLTFQVKPKTNKVLPLRAFLDEGGDTLTETWSYVIMP